MTDEHEHRDRIVAVLLAQVGIPVPEAEIGKLREMYWGAEPARSTVRAIQKGESEPLTIFVPNPEAKHE